MFITFEGIDGCGKTTQVQYLKNFFLEKGYNVITTREPGSTILSEQIREILLNSKYAISPITELFLFNAARMHLIDTVIIPALKNNDIVISDRFFDSTTAYQGFGHNTSIKDINQCNDIIKKYSVTPNITFFLDISIEKFIKRRKNTKKDRIEALDTNFFKKVIEGYHYIAKQEPKRIKIIDANNDIETTFKQIEQYIVHII